MAPTKQAKVIKEFQKQSAQLDMTVNTISIHFSEALAKIGCVMFGLCVFTDRDDVRGN